MKRSFVGYLEERVSLKTAALKAHCVVRREWDTRDTKHRHTERPALGWREVSRRSIVEAASSSFTDTVTRESHGARCGCNVTTWVALLLLLLLLLRGKKDGRRRRRLEESTGTRASMVSSRISLSAADDCLPNASPGPDVRANEPSDERDERGARAFDQRFLHQPLLHT